MSGFAFYVVGTPGPQGSKRFMGRGATGKGIMVESSAKVRPWREAVKMAAPAIERTLDGPLAVKMVFTLHRPKSARRTDTRPMRTPDCSKLARSTEDAITDAGLWVDDARVVEYVRLAKVWHGYDSDSMPVPGVIVAVVELNDDPIAWELQPLFHAAQRQANARIRGAA